MIVAIVAGFLAVVGISAVAVALVLDSPSERTKDRAETSGTKGTDKTVTHPENWDPRLTDLVAFVERARGLSFKHPASVRFLSPKKYEKENAAEQSDLSKQDRKDLETTTDLFRALALIDDKADLLKIGNEMMGLGTLAYYDPESEGIVVRGTEITLAMKVTLVHELTHALQDQWFDLTKADDTETDGEYTAFTALVEGDAIRIENEFLAGLTSEELEKLEKEEQAESGGPENIPAAVDALYGSPYALGPQLVSLIHAQGGNSAVDQAFREPPKSEEHIVDPFSYLNGDEPKHVAVPKPAKGEKKVHSGDFGSVGWLVVLSQRIDPQIALTAVDGWGGDSYLQFRRGSSSCVRASFLGDTPGDTDQMAEALNSWTGAKPKTGGSNSVVARSGSVVNFEACAGGGSAAPSPSSEDLLVLPAARSEVGLSFMQLGASRGTARCIGQATIEAFTVKELTSGSLMTDEPSPAIVRKLDRAANSCS